MANTPVTVTSSDDYVIVVDSNNVGDDVFRLAHGTATGTETLINLLDRSAAYRQAVEQVSAANLKFHRTSGVVFWMTGTAGDSATWRHPLAASPEPALKATLDSNGALIVNVGSLRLPVLTTLPASPTSGEWILFEDTDGGARRGRLAVYLNGGWRYSAAL